MKRKKIGENLTAGRKSKLVYVLSIRLKTIESPPFFRTFTWGTFPSKGKAIDYIKKNPKGARTTMFECWVIYEMIEDSDSMKKSNYYDREGNEICTIGAMFKNDNGW